MFARRHPLETLRSFFDAVPIKLDFHNQSPGQFHRMVKAAEWRPKLGPVDLLVAIGHSKEHIDDQKFDALLSKIASDDSLKVATFADVLEKLQADEPAWAESVAADAR